LSHRRDTLGDVASHDEIIHRTARSGIVTRGHLLDAGLSEHDIKGRVARGSLRTVHAGVYATFGRTLDYETGVLAACFAAGEGAVASHRSALAMWGLLDGPQPIEITAPRNHHPLPDRVVVHRPNVLRPVDVTERRGVPITNPLRSLLDAGAVLPRGRVGDCVERALVARLVSIKGLRLILAELGGRGRAGTGALRQHLDRRALGDRRPESMIEPLIARLLYDDLGIGPVEYQPTVLIAGRRFRPDFRIPAAMTIVEVDGLDAHASRQALDSDLERQNLFVRSGYLVLRYTVTHLRRPAKVAAEVQSVCRERIEQVGRLTA
jgi:very-short-patch-repair endonuclease